MKRQIQWRARIVLNGEIEVWVLYILVTQGNPWISHFLSKWIYCIPLDSKVIPVSFEFWAADTRCLTLGESGNFLSSVELLIATTGGWWKDYVDNSKKVLVWMTHAKLATKACSLWIRPGFYNKNFCDWF